MTARAWSPWPAGTATSSSSTRSLWTGQIHDARLFGLPGRRGHVTFRLLHIFDLTGDQIRAERVWADVAAIAEQT